MALRTELAASIKGWHSLALMLCALLPCLSARAQQAAVRCPWLNAATASGVLGGEVRLSVTDSAKGAVDQPNGAPGDSTCEFVLMNGPAAAMLRIAVHTMQDHARDYPAFVSSSCGASARRVVGVGNEAIACSLQAGAMARDQIVGRVRQRAFVLSVLMPKTAGDAKATQAALDKLQNTAEQIAGSLF